MDYSKASDFEINKRLAELLGLPSGKSLNPLDYDLGEWLDMVDDTPAPPDYCNSWADMGSVIYNNQISIYSFITYWRCSSLLVKDIGSYVDHKNPLRAAAIVAIQVLEAKQ